MLQPIAGNPTLGRYTLLRRIAVGGMGEVFLARERGAAGVDRLVVVKRLLGDPLDGGDPVAELLDEARLTARLAHPNIVQLHEVGDDGGERFLVMELVPSQNLARVRARLAQDGRRVPLAIAGFILIEAARGLAYAHDARDADGRPLHVVHRDVTPSNILVGYRGEVKLADFGIAKARDRQARTRTGVLRGKVPYMAPEQILGQDVDSRSDVWALGVIAWELAAGRPLFDGASELETIRLVTDQPIVDPTAIDPTCPPAVAAVILAALERDRDRRVPSAERFASELRAALKATAGVADATELAAVMAGAFPDEQRELAELPGAVVEAEQATVQTRIDPPAPLAPPRANRRGPVIVAALGVAVAAGIAAVAITRPSSAPPARVAVAAPDAVTPVATTDAAARATTSPDAHPLDASPGPDARDGHRRPLDPDRGAPIDAAPATTPPPAPPDAAAAAIDAAAAPPAQIRFSVGDGQVVIDGKRYRGGTPRVPPGPHRIEVRLLDGRVFETDLDAAAGEVYKCVLETAGLRCGR